MHQIIGNDMITGMGFIGTEPGKLYRMNGRRTVEKTASGNPITLTDSAENKPLGMKLYGWSKQDGTPSPDNPVEIESAGMRWSTGAQLFNKNDYALNQVISPDGSLVPGAAFSSSNFILVEAGMYTITATGSIRCKIYDENKQPLTTDSYTDYNLSSGATFQVEESVKYIRFSFENKYLESIMLNKGDTALPYEPYTGGVPKPYGDKVGIDVHGKNLFHITKESDCDKSYNNTTKRVISSGEFVFGLSWNNYFSSVSAFVDFKTFNISFVYASSSGYGIGVGVSCEKGNTYSFGCKTNKGIVYACFYDANGKSLSRVLISTYNIFSIPDVAEQVVIVFTNASSANNGDTIWFNDIHIEKASEATSYEPYRTPQSTSIITPNGLPGIPVPSNTAGITYTDASGQAWIADEIDLKRGKYVQRVWKGEFDGSENWLAYDYMKGFLLATALPYTMTNRAYLSNQYVSNLRIGMNQKSLYLDSSSFYDTSLDDKGLSNFKAHLAANPLVVMTYIDTPIERDLTTAELAEYTQLYSYKPTTVVENDSGCWMDVTYRGKK